MRVTTGLAALALLAGLAAAQGGTGDAGEPGSLEDVLGRRPGAGELVLESRERGAPQPAVSPPCAPSPSLPDLVLHADAIVHARGLQRRDDWLRLDVVEHLWGTGPDELFVLNRALAPALVDGAGDAEWVVFLGVSPDGLAAIGAIDAGVVPLTGDGLRPPEWPGAAPVPLAAALDWVGRLLDCRVGDGGVRLAALLSGACRAPKEPADSLVALQVAALLAREPAFAAQAGALRAAAVHLPRLVGSTYAGADAGTAASLDVARLEAVPAPGGSAWGLAIEAVAPHAPPACVLSDLLRGREPRLHARHGLAPREQVAALAVARAAAARAGQALTEPPESDVAALRAWMLAGWPELLLQDLDFVEACLRAGAPDDLQAGGECVRRLTGWTDAELAGAPDDARADLLARFRAWCAASTGP